MLTDTEIARRMGQTDARRARRDGRLHPFMAMGDEAWMRLRDRLRLTDDARYAELREWYGDGWDGVITGRGRPSMGQTTRVCLLLKDYDVRSIDDMATKAGMTRAAWMREAILDYLSREVHREEVEGGDVGR